MVIAENMFGAAMYELVTYLINRLCPKSEINLRCVLGMTNWSEKSSNWKEQELLFKSTKILVLRVFLITSYIMRDPSICSWIDRGRSRRASKIASFGGIGPWNRGYDL